MSRSCEDMKSNIRGISEYDLSKAINMAISYKCSNYDFTNVHTSIMHDLGFNPELACCTYHPDLLKKINDSKTSEKTLPTNTENVD